jgi:hypothetical protein
MGSMDYVYGKYGLRLWEVWTTFMGNLFLLVLAKDYIYGKSFLWLFLLFKDYVYGKKSTHLLHKDYVYGKKATVSIKRLHLWENFSF